jgi:MFS family permease
MDAPADLPSGASADEPNAGSAAGLWAAERRGLTTGLLLATTFLAGEELAVITICRRSPAISGAWTYTGGCSASPCWEVWWDRGRRSRGRPLGPARPFVTELPLFGSGLAVAGLAPTMAVLVVGRFLQGLGAGAVPAIAYVAIGRSLPERLRARMMAVLASAWVVPALLGPALRAAVAHLFGWRTVFAGLIPLAGAGLLALPALVRIGRPAAETAPEHRLRDAVRTALGAGMALQALASGSVLLAGALILVGVAVGLPSLRRLLPAGTLAAQ